MSATAPLPARRRGAIPTLASISDAVSAIGNTLVFEGTDTSGKQALFQSDGTAAGSKELTLPAGAVVNPSSVIEALPALSGAAPITLGGGAQSYNAPAGSQVVAGSGSDTVLALSGKVTVTGGAGSLTFIGGSGASSVAGGAGQAIIFGGSGGGTFAGGTGGHNVLVSPRRGRNQHDLDRRRSRRPDLRLGERP